MFILENAQRFWTFKQGSESTELDKGAMIKNSFSNLFLGDVIRLEAKDLPLYQASLRYSIPKHSLHFKIQYTSEFDPNGLSEIDFWIGKRVLKQVQLSAIGGYIKSPT